MDFPKAIKDWTGTFTLFGSSGAGKTYFLVDMIERYLRSVSSGAAIRPIIWLSPEEKIDKTLAPLKKPRWSAYYHGVDISEKAVRDSTAPRSTSSSTWATCSSGTARTR